MNYYIKVGKMYVKNIFLDTNSIKTEFIEEINLKNKKDYCKKICKEEQEFYVEKISNILELVTNQYDIITFEEVEEDE